MLIFLLLRPQVWQVKDPTERGSPRAERAEPPKAFLEQNFTQNDDAMRKAIETHLKKAEEVSKLCRKTHFHFSIVYNHLEL